MIGQYLPNNNEKSYSAVLQNFLHLNQPLVLLLRGLWFMVSSIILSWLDHIYIVVGVQCLVILGVFRCPNSGLNSGHEQCLDTVAILFFGNNCLNIDELGSKYSSRKVQ
jgi:hypothetical protein